MARDFTAASSHVLRNTSGALSSTPFTMACWFRCNDVTTNYQLMGVFRNSAPNSGDYHSIVAGGATAGDPVRVLSNDAGTAFGGASSSTGYTANTWHHACGVWSATNSRTAYLDGGNSGTDTTSVGSITTSFNRTTVGANDVATPTGYLDGRVAEAAMWNVALAAAEIAALADGFTPDQVRPDSLVAYWPLVGRYSTELDLTGGFPLTVTGAAAADHPPVRRRKRKTVFLPAPAAPPATNRRRRVLLCGSR